MEHEHPKYVFLINEGQLYRVDPYSGDAWVVIHHPAAEPPTAEFVKVKEPDATQTAE